MRKYAAFMLLSLVIFAGCSSTQTIIDWVDFIKWGGEEYNGIYTGVLADTEFLGKPIGTVKFKVADNVTDPNYKTKEGDAAFHEKGTVLYSIKGYPNLMAVKSKQAIGGYQVYYSRKDTDYRWFFKDMPLDKVNRISIYRVYPTKGNKLIAFWKNKEEVDRLLLLLKTSKESPNFQPNTKNGDPVFYEMVFYTEGPIAYKFALQFDGNSYFWYPWDPSILSDKIKDFLPDQ